MNTGPKYPIKKEVRYAKLHQRILKNISDVLAKQYPHSQMASENNIIRGMMEHCATCELYLSSLSIDENISTD